MHVFSMLNLLRNILYLHVDTIMLVNYSKHERRMDERLVALAERGTEKKRRTYITCMNVWN